MIGSIAVCVLTGGAGCEVGAVGLELGVDLAIAAGSLHIDKHC